MRIERHTEGQTGDKQQQDTYIDRQVTSSHTVRQTGRPAGIQIKKKTGRHTKKTDR